MFGAHIEFAGLVQVGVETRAHFIVRKINRAISEKVLRWDLLADLDHLARRVGDGLVVGLHVALRNLLQLRELVLGQLQGV